MVFVAQLLIYGFHELTEANIFPYSEPLHLATEPYGPDGPYGKYLTYILVLLPMAWLAASMLFGQRKPATVQSVAQGHGGSSPTSHSGARLGA
jgi:high-affinity iron transporter